MTVLAPLAEKNPKAKAAKPEEFADSGFIKALDQSRYIDGLYKIKGNDSVTIDSRG